LLTLPAQKNKGFPMTRFTLVLLILGLGSTILPALNNLIAQPIVDVKPEKADKFEIKPGPWDKPQRITTEKDFAKFITDETTKKRLMKLIDFKEQDLVVFCWEGSGADKLEYVVLESFPEQLRFSRKPGATDDLRKHIHLYIVRKNVSLSAK